MLNELVQSLAEALAFRDEDMVNVAISDLEDYLSESV